MKKNKWHDLKSSLTSIQLGVKMLLESPELQRMGFEDSLETLKMIDEKVELSIQQVKELRSNSNDS